MANRKNNCFIFSLIASLAVSLLFLPLPAHSQGPVTLDVGYGANLPDTTGNPVSLSIDNPNGAVEGISLEVCDAGNFLSPSAPISCETTDRAPGFSCSTSELSGGCMRVLLFDLGGGVIEVGQGPIATLYYDVSSQAQLFLGECRDLTIQNAQVSDEFGSPVPVGDIFFSTGQFCFQNPPSCLGVTPGSGMQ